MRDPAIGAAYALGLGLACGAALTTFFIVADYVEWAWLLAWHDIVIAERAFDGNLSRDEAFGGGVLIGLIVFGTVVSYRRSEGRWPHEKAPG